ncbi:hypothetical protein [Dactylosporangium sp. NPDC051484]|uniref:hypothetical protein n=1 Tax=Dactylosporangium sp. NPDC051484 TaxID=3154942 RepID=UPI00344D4AB2
MPDGDAQQIVLTSDDIGSRDGHAASAHVLRQRHAGQRREHPAQVVLGRAERPGQSVDVQLLCEVLLDKVDEPVECRDHETLLSTSTLAEDTPTAPDRCGPIRSCAWTVAALTQQVPPTGRRRPAGSAVAVLPESLIHSLIHLRLYVRQARPVDRSSHVTFGGFLAGGLAGFGLGFLFAALALSGTGDR